MWVAKYSEKRVSRKMRSPMESAGGVTSASGVGSGARLLSRTGDSEEERAGGKHAKG
jgi:hypothetical protein